MLFYSFSSYTAPPHHTTPSCSFPEQTGQTPNPKHQPAPAAGQSATTRRAATAVSSTVQEATRVRNEESPFEQLTSSVRMSHQRTNTVFFPGGFSPSRETMRRICKMFQAARDLRGSRLLPLCCNDTIKTVNFYGNLRWEGYFGSKQDYGGLK